MIGNMYGDVMTDEKDNSARLDPTVIDPVSAVIPHNLLVVSATFCEYTGSDRSRSSFFFCNAFKAMLDDTFGVNLDVNNPLDEKDLENFINLDILYIYIYLNVCINK
jgi:hypothetical protein